MSIDLSYECTDLSHECVLESSMGLSSREIYYGLVFFLTCTLMQAYKI